MSQNARYLAEMHRIILFFHYHLCVVKRIVNYKI